jgi:hypothetical protein
LPATTSKRERRRGVGPLDQRDVIDDEEAIRSRIGAALSEQAPFELEAKSRPRAAVHHEVEAAVRERARLAVAPLTRREDADSCERCAVFGDDAASHDRHAELIEDGLVDVELARARAVVEEPNGRGEGDGADGVDGRRGARVRAVVEERLAARVVAAAAAGQDGEERDEEGEAAHRRRDAPRRLAPARGDA